VLIFLLNRKSLDLILSQEIEESFIASHSNRLDLEIVPLFSIDRLDVSGQLAKAVNVLAGTPFTDEYAKDNCSMSTLSVQAINTELIVRILSKEGAQIFSKFSGLL